MKIVLTKSNMASHPQVMVKVVAHRNIPPHHPEATEAHKAYPLRELVRDLI